MIKKIKFYKIASLLIYHIKKLNSENDKRNRILITF